MRVLITGNEGFIGGRLAEFYLSKGDTVFGWGFDGCYPYGGQTENLSLMEPEDVKKALKKMKPDLIMHCAGSADVNLSVKEPMKDLRNNYITTHNVLFAMKDLKLEDCRFVLFSSAAVYGNPVRLPMDENEPINPLSPYALHKMAAEETSLFMQKNYGLDIKILRIFSVFGPGLRKQIFWDMYQKYKNTGKLELWGSGQESRDYIYIDDLVSAAVLIASGADRDDNVFNIANGKETTIREAAECFGRHIGMDMSDISFMGVRREGDPINWRADISKLTSLGYIQRVSFDDGIREYVKWVTEF